MSFAFQQSQDDYKNDIKPEQSPPFHDSISSIAWAGSSFNNVFATTSWDSKLRLFSVAAGQPNSTLFQHQSLDLGIPALKCIWNEESTQIYLGMVDGSLKIFDVGSCKFLDLGRHDQPISSLNLISGRNALISTSYSKLVRIWSQGRLVMTIDAMDKVFASDYRQPFYLAATADYKVALFDILNTNAPRTLLNSQLGKGSALQSIAMSPKGDMYGVSSIDGRANLTAFTKSNLGSIEQKSVITFKSNKQEQNGCTILYPVNTCAFNPLHDKWFLTAGADGYMHFWDYEKKSKIRSLNYRGFPICVAKVSQCGQMVAYGLGDDWHMGSLGKDNWKNEPKLGVHVIGQKEIYQDRK